MPCADKVAFNAADERIKRVETGSGATRAPGK
ncbi:hypothetical protein BN439_1449 [Erwinia amylovora Ea644]|nr:hypothetical protein BN439_1449 [Erwinia amylovora Ea644]CCP06534.1 hypothetical protein BN440_1492 [Erwinia amylovora MR1]